MKRLHEKLSNKPVTKQKQLKLSFYHKKAGLAAGFLFIMLLVLLYGTGNASNLVNAFPLIKFGSKQISLSCQYNGENITTSLTVYSNINQYYKNLGNKDGIISSGDYSKFTNSSRNDTTIKSLAEKIKTIADSKHFTDDQMIELAACFVQNIPYDEDKAKIVLSSTEIANKDLAQYPYETLFKNSGICTDKTYLASAIIRELGYGTGILLFPDAEHMALGIQAPSGYTDFDTKFTYMEVTSPGFAPGEIPEDVNNSNGKAAVAIKKLEDISLEQDPASIEYKYNSSNTYPNAVIGVNDGKSYQRIVLVKDLQDKIIKSIDTLTNKKATLNASYNELIKRNRAQDYAYSSYLSTPSTKLDCGYKYDYSYSYSFSYSYDYTYRSPYTYRCDTISNSQKSFAYSSYLSALRSYNNQVDFYNGLLNDYNKGVDMIRADINRYKSYDYN